MTGVDYANNAGGKGWNRNIKYDKKEYAEFIKRIRGVIERLGGAVKAVDVERVGWVLGREKAVIQGGFVDCTVGTSEPAVARKEPKVALKRKAEESTGTVEKSLAGPRRSKRQRK